MNKKEDIGKFFVRAGRTLKYKTKEGPFHFVLEKEGALYRYSKSDKRRNENFREFYDYLDE